MKDHTIEVKNDRKLTVEDGNDSTEVSKGNISIKAVQGKIEVEAAQSIKLTVGPSTLELTTSSIKLAIGASTLELTASGIKLNGTAIEITGLGTAKLTSPMTTVNADGPLTLKGAVVMIN